ncbi:hypothetical protein Tco_0316085 [Tanacetum coccineum]
MAIEESKDLTSLSLDELIRNLKVHEMIIKKDSEIVKAKREKKSLAFKAKKESSDEESLTLGSKDEEFAMAVRDFKKFFKRRGRYGDPNHRIEEFLKPPRDKNQRAFVRGSWSNIGKKYDENANDETCLMAQASIELFFTYKAYNGGNVIFGSNLRGNIIGKGTISHGSLYIANVEHVDNLGFNLLSVGQICDSKCKVIFSEHDSETTKDGKVIESLNVTFDETPPPSKTSPLVDDDLDEEEAIKVTEKKNIENDIEDETLEVDEIVNIKESKNHPLDNVIGNLNLRTLRSQAQNQSNFFCFISTIEPKNVNKALKDGSWIVAMQEELNQIIANDV